MRGSQEGKSSLDRRGAMKLAAGLGAAVAGMSATSSAIAQEKAKEAMEREPEPKWRRYRIGDAVVTVVLDGLRPGDGPYPTFGADQDEASVAALMRENFLPEKRFVNGFLPVIVETGGQIVLFDTGMGAMGRQNGMGQLRERMSQAGYETDDVDLVVLTHFHGDHIGGLMEDGKPAFGKARYAAGQVEYDWWTSDEAKNGERKDGAALVGKNVVPLKDRMTFLKEGDEVAPGITAQEAFGHSPGHMVFEVKSGDKVLWLTADSANHYVASLQKPGWKVRFDQDSAKAEASRRRVFDRVAQARAPFIGYHMPFPGIGFVEKTGDGYRFVPLTYQLDIET
nr:MBL fold metallo-hydrolase [Aureimonas psammosilenae]